MRPPQLSAPLSSSQAGAARLTRAALADPAAGWRVWRYLNEEDLPGRVMTVAPDLRHAVLAEEQAGIPVAAYVHQLCGEGPGLELGPRVAAVKCKGWETDYLWHLDCVFVKMRGSILVYPPPYGAASELSVPDGAYMMHGQAGAVVLDMRAPDGRRAGSVIVCRGVGGAWLAQPQPDLPWLWERLCESCSVSHTCCNPITRSPHISGMVVHVEAYEDIILRVSVGANTVGAMLLHRFLADEQRLLGAGFMCYRSPTWLSSDTVALNWGTRYWVVGW